MDNKIKTLEELKDTLSNLKSKGQKIVHCHGVFDLMHLGHIRYFKEAKSFGDLLVITITPDAYVRRGPARPAFSSELRAESIAALDVVNYVAINKWQTAVKTIKLLKPDFYVKGPDYKNYEKDVTGNIQREEDAINSVGGEIKITSDITFSSTKLVNRYFNLYNADQKNFINSLKEKYSLEKINNYIHKLKDLKVLTVGETILDEYIFCEALGKSGKEPVLVTREIKSEIYLGGILAIANHLSDFCNNIEIVSFLGEKGESEDFIKENLGAGIKTNFLYKTNSPTITKKRFIDNTRKSKLLGVYDINDEIINRADEQLFKEKLVKSLPEYDLVIVADYGHGIITKRIAKLLTEKSSFLAFNTQVNAANIGYHSISKYTRANCVIINAGELMYELRDRSTDLETLTKQLADNLITDSIIVTKGSAGVLLYNTKEGYFTSCPAFAHYVVDIIGAGDALLAITSICISIGIPDDLSLFIGSLAAAQSVETMGNSKPVNKVDLLKAMDSILN